VKHGRRWLAASMIVVQPDDEVSQRHAVLACGLSDAHPSAECATPPWRPSSGRELAVPREDAEVAFAAVIVGRHVASAQEGGDALEAIAQPRLQALHVVVQSRVALVDDASESDAKPVSDGGVSSHLCLLG